MGATGQLSSTRPCEVETWLSGAPVGAGPRLDSERSLQDQSLSVSPGVTVEGGRLSTPFAFVEPLGLGFGPGLAWIVSKRFDLVQSVLSLRRLVAVDILRRPLEVGESRRHSHTTRLLPDCRLPALWEGVHFG